MRIIIASVMTRAQLSDSLDSVSNRVRQLLGHSTVSAIYLLVARSHTDLFREAIQCCDPRLEIISVAVGSDYLSCYRWHYKNLPVIASQLRADAVHLAYPVILKEKAFFPGTALSLDARHCRRPTTAPGLSRTILGSWILTQCLGVLSKIAYNSEASLEQVGLGSILSLEKAVRTLEVAEASRKASADQERLAPQNKGAYP
jgi:hypothetical protein